MITSAIPSARTAWKCRTSRFALIAELEALAAFIDKHLGGTPWVLAITSDHGVAPVPNLPRR